MKIENYFTCSIVTYSYTHTHTHQTLKAQHCSHTHTHTQEEGTPIVSTETSDMDYLRSKIVTTDVPHPQSDNSDSSDTESDSHSATSCEDEAPPTQLGSTPYTVKMLGLPFSVKEKEISEFFHPIPVVSVRFTTDQQGRPSGRGYVDFQCEDDIQRALKRNKDCIRHRYIELFRDDVPQATVKEESVVSNRPWERTKNKQEIEDVSESGRLFVRNLSYTTSEDALTNLFEKFGPLTEVTIPLDKNTNKSTGIAFITFMLPEHAVKAYDSVDGQIFQGRLLHILPAKPRNSRDEGETKVDSSYKNKKQQKTKSEAGKGHNWNTLFLGPNAVVDAIADKYSVDKSSILDPTSEGSAAVRVALGETQLIAETRGFMENRGVHLEMFGDEKRKRSKTIILVKNLPYGTTEVELVQLFESFGQLSQIILPSNGISAVVEFAEPSHARNAFQKLAYTSFKHLPLYLEWAPDAVIEKKVTEQASEANGDDDQSVKEGTTLFVKNLNFNTCEDSLQSLMTRVGRVKSVSIAKKLNMKDPSKPLSMGYGFVEFTTRKAAMKAIKNLQHSDLDGHKLELKLSTREAKTVDQVKKRGVKETEQKSSKILVRNVPFEASKREIKDLFQTFGQLKTARLPKKFGSSQNEHRGFGFVEFVTKEDAKRAFDSLSQSTHLYGRRLVLEWAEQEESVEAIRKRTAEHFHGFKLPREKRNKNSELTLLNSLDRQNE